MPAPRVRWLALGAGALLVQIALIHGLARLPGGVGLLPVLLPLAHAILLPFLLRNLSFWGMRLILVGLLLNLTVMLANGGLMPVEAATVEAVRGPERQDLRTGDHIPGTKNVLVAPGDVRLRQLSDVLVPPLPRPLTRAVSAGDLFVIAGAALAFGEVVSRRASSRGVPNA